MADEPPKVKAPQVPPAAAVPKAPRVPQPATVKLGPAPVGAVPTAAATPIPRGIPLKMPSPAEVVPPSHTAKDRGLEVRMAIGVANTAPHQEGDLLRLDPGLRLRQYELIRELGRGGMGQVYLARDIKLARRVAIKFLATATRELTERFLSEARTTAAVSHENIVVIHEVDEHQGTPHMVLEYLEGTALRELMRGRAFSPARVVEMIAPVMRAVVRAHDAGIVHRDLKPENIFVTIDGAIKVLDFGIAKALVAPDANGAAGRLASANELEHLAEHALTGGSAIIGTPQYMSPEQFGIDRVDHRSDIWAIGVIMFELLTGKHPLAPYTIQSLLASAAQLDEPMPKIGSVVHDLPERLERIVDRCIAKKKADRYPDAKSLLADLEALLPGRFGRKLREDESPYPGLTAFQEEDADRFFGRGRDVSRMLQRLRDQPLVGIAGPSGIGKSSFVRAGVVPGLKASGDAWESYIVRPGRDPIAALASILAPVVSGNSLDGTRQTNQRALEEHDDVAGLLVREPGYLGTALRERAARKNTRILLFIDQFEELYTLVDDPVQRRVFTQALAGAADDPSSPIRIMLSVRSDFLDRVGEDRGFLDELTRGLVFLQPLGRPELCEALTRPLDMLGYDFEGDEIVDRMLPLLQFAASRLWDARDRKNKLLTRAAHDAMGGISGALATHADEVLMALPVASHSIVRAIFQRLVTPERTRALAELTELRDLGGDVSRVIDHLVQARLLVVQTQGTVEIVHESLITSWPTLRRWLDESQEDAAFLAQLRTAAKQWEQKGRPPGLLWRGDEAREARQWHARYRGELPSGEHAYLHAVISLATRTTRLRRIALAATFLVLGGIAAGASIAYVRVRAAEQVAMKEKAAAEDALAKEKASEVAKAKAEQARLEALADLLSEEELRKAAEEGKISAEQLAQLQAIKARLAEQRAAQAQGQLADAEAQKKKMAEQLAKAEADKRAAEEASKAHAAEAQLSREDLLKKTKELEVALAAAKTAQTRAETARTDAEDAKAQLTKALAVEKARAERAEQEGKKILKGDLK
jgi:serine/threonine protein kinase